MNNPGAAMVGMAGGAVGAPNMINQVGGGRGPPGPEDINRRLNTYIYDHLCRLKHYELARSFVNLCPIRIKTKKEVNGDNDLDMDSKDDVKRPDDLPNPDIPEHFSENSFLYDWWAQFWDIYATARKTGNNQSSEAYLAHNMQQTKFRQMHQQSMLRNGNIPMQQFGNVGMQPNGMNMAKQAAINNRNGNANMMQAKMQHNAMQRDGSVGGAEQRPQSPGSMGNAPSPSKRPRLDDGNFNGQPGQAGRGQPMQGNQMNNMPGVGPNGAMMLQNGMPTDLTPQQMATFAQGPNGQQKLDISAGGMPQGALGEPGSFQVMESQRAAMTNGAGTTNSAGNHALQDYQMQLMLLEQQNKKRLLMARQEQDNINHVPGSSQPGQMQFAGAPAMSPSNSRPGPSPNPNDQMKRIGGTPKMGPGNIPGSPAMAGDMNRGSPVPGFDQNGVPPNIRQQMYANQQGMMGQPPSSHPAAFNMMNAQNMEQMRLAQAQGRLPNGQWQPGQGPPAQMMQNPGQPGQIGAPLQRNPMPPPPAPNTEQQRTQPSSPAQQPGPPTPSQANKPAPKGKKETAKKKAAPKKGAAATPAADTNEPPATPTPSTPITPMHPASFGNKPGANATAGGPANQQAAPVPAMDSAPFADINAESNFNLDFSNDGPDILDTFDFDSFLHNTDDANGFDLNFMNIGLDGTEATAGS